MTTERPEYHPDDHITAERPPGLTQQWQAWINARVARSEQRMLRLAMETVGAALAEERKRARAELDAELVKLRAEFDGARRLHAVPPPRIA